MYRRKKEIVFNSLIAFKSGPINCSQPAPRMQVHVIYSCPRCACHSFRPSATRVRKDSILRMLGVYPHRCYICKIRFYLFQPGILKTLARPIETPATAGLEAQPLRPGMLSPR